MNPYLFRGRIAGLADLPPGLKTQIEIDMSKARREGRRTSPRHIVADSIYKWGNKGGRSMSRDDADLAAEALTRMYYRTPSNYTAEGTRAFPSEERRAKFWPGGSHEASDSMGAPHWTALEKRASRRRHSPMEQALKKLGFDATIVEDEIRAPQRTVAVMDGSKLRHPAAKFDPKKEHLNNVFLSAPGAGLLAALLARNFEREQTEQELLGGNI